jgi:3-deoxy-D-manno-octulosonic-acid transferase
MIYIYKILTVVVFIVSLPIGCILYFFSKKRKATLCYRLGISNQFSDLKQTDKKTIWVHALSVGEVKSSVPVIEALNQKKKEIRIVYTTTTKTGQDMARVLFLNGSAPCVEQVGYFPFDLGWCIQRILQRINPSAVILVETDLWPNFLFKTKKENIPVVLINARLSDRSLKRYSWCRPFARLFFSCLSRILVQTQEDKNRYKQLGVPEDQVDVTGNIKFDQPCEPMDKREIDRFKQQLGIQKDRPIVLAGSTHEGEEHILLDWFLDAIQTNKHLLMIIAPRDPDRSFLLNDHCQSNEISSVLLSQMMPGLVTAIASDLVPVPNAQSQWPQVIFVDQMGVLAKLYAVCDIAFIGGSMVARGGHNPLEAAAYSKPILFGKDMSDFQEISDLLVNTGGAIKIESDVDLGRQLNHLLKDPVMQEKMGKNNDIVFHAHSGAVKNIIFQLEQLNIV